MVEGEVQFEVFEIQAATWKRIITSKKSSFKTI